jgi:hypothetical protein
MCLLLPDAPLGHCLHLHIILSRLAEREPDIPDSACWRVPAKQISSGVLDDDFSDRCALMLESTLVVSTLMLSITVEALFNPPEKCADGTECETLLNLDAALWGVWAVPCFFFQLVLPGSTWWARRWCYVASSQHL